MQTNLKLRVAAQNKVNAEAIRLHAIFVEAFRPYIGKKVVKQGGDLVAKLNETLAPVFREWRNVPTQTIWPQRITGWIGWNIRLDIWEGNEARASAEAAFTVGELARDLRGLNHTDVLALLKPAPELRTDYNVGEIENARVQVKQAREILYAAERKLHGFGERDT